MYMNCMKIVSVIITTKSCNSCDKMRSKCSACSYAYEGNGTAVRVIISVESYEAQITFTLDRTSSQVCVPVYIHEKRYVQEVGQKLFKIKDVNQKCGL